MTTQHAALPAFKQAWPWQEDQIIRTTKTLGFDPKALPADDPKRGFYVKSLVRERCGKNHPTQLRKTIFDKAWDRMLASDPPALIYIG